MLYKTFATMLLAVAASALLADDAQARWWWQRSQRTCPAPVMVTTPAAPGTAQAGQTSTYQSFSYEPGVPATTTTAPRSSRGSEPWRYGDNKASGRYLWNSR